MKNKILDILIYILVFAILIAGGVFFYQTFLVKSYNISLELNGADNIDGSITQCVKSLKGCYVILPKATRSNGVVLGYNLNPNYKEARYKEGEKVYLKEDTTLYVISYVTRNVHIEKNDTDFLENVAVSCNAYNTYNSCTIKMPNFNKVGYKNAGYSTKRNTSYKTPGEYFPNEEYEINGDLKLYPKYSNDRRGENKIYNTKQVYEINSSFVEAQKNTPNDVINKYKGYLDEISKQAPFLFTGSKITLLEKNTFGNLWGRGVVGICYGSSIEGHPLSRSIDVLYNYGDADYEKYFTLVHEMTHAWDFYYPYKLTGKIPKVGDLGRIWYNSTAEYNQVFGTERISAQKDIIALFNKYKRQYPSTRPFGDYAYSAVTEFVAEAFAHYYAKYLVPLTKYKDMNYPDDIKTTLEKYICVAKNNYDASKCSN